MQNVKHFFPQQYFLVRSLLRHLIVTVLAFLLVAVFAFSAYLMFNPVWWFCLVFLAAGLVGTSRMILRQHSLLQVIVGFVVGIVCSVVGLIYL